jgi:signal transduction histidine kinase
VSDVSSFSRLVSLACHDVRTPLATVSGFAKTIEKAGNLEPPADRYMQIIGQASEQMAELLDELSLAARIESGRYDPVLRETDTRTLAEGARARLGEERVTVSGEGAPVTTDIEAVERGVSALAQSALRHGGLEEIGIVVRGTEIEVSPVTPASAAVVLGEDLRDLGAAVAVRLVAALGGGVSLAGETLTIRLA